MRANRSTLVKLCLLTALAIPAQRSIAADSPQGSASNAAGQSANSPQLVAQNAIPPEEPAAAVTSPDGSLVARTNDSDLAIIEDASGNLVAGPLEGAGGAVTALAFNEDGTLLATGTNTGQVRYWDTTTGEAQGEAFSAVLGTDNAVSEMRFEGNDKLFVAGSQGRQGLWGLNGLSFGERVPVDGAAGVVVSEGEADGFPWWWLLLPILGLVGVGLWLLGRDRNATNPDEPKRQIAPTATVTPPRTDPESDREVSSRAQTIISTDRVVDDSRSVIPSVTPPPAQPLPVGEPGVDDETIITEASFESTDLEESPDLDGTNLDLLTPGEVTGATFGGAAILGGMAVATDELNSSIEDDDDDEEWDDNLDLSLDDEPITPEIRQAETEMPVANITAPDIPEPDISEPDIPAFETDPSGVSDDDFWNTVSDSAGFAASEETAIAPNDENADIDFGNLDTSNINSIEPTRDTVIAETDTVLDIEPDQNTIIGDRAVIFGGAAAAGTAIAAASINPEMPESERADIDSADIDSFFGASEPSSTNDIVNRELAETGFAIVEPDVESNLSVFEENVSAESVSADDIDAESIVTVEQPIFSSLEDLEESDSVEEPTSLDTLETSTELETLEGKIVTDDGNRAVSENDLTKPNNKPNDEGMLAGSAAELAAATTLPTAAKSRLSVEELASVDDGLTDLPEGYGDSRIVLLPRDPRWAYAYWDISNDHKEALRQQGGQKLMLRLCDVTDIDQTSQAAHSMQQQECHEMARSWYIEMPMSDRDYTAEIGYLTGDGRWLMLARSASVRVPPIYPSDWVKDQFVTVGTDSGLAGKSFGNLGSPKALAEGEQTRADSPASYEALFAFTQAQETLRLAGSLYGSMQAMPPGALSASGEASGLNRSGLNVSGLNMSGIGIGDRQRSFWLVADAELIVYGATEPDATLTIGDRVIPLNPDGTFRFHMPFPNGNINYPIRAVAADGEQERSVTLNFDRETPERNTNTKAEAKNKWF